MNLQVAWILIQGAFLPLVLWLDDLRVTGSYWGLGIFCLLEILYLVDSLLFIKIFQKGEKMEHSKHKKNMKGKHMMTSAEMKKHKKSMKGK